MPNFSGLEIQMPHHSTTRVLTTHVGSLIRPDPMVSFLRQQDEERPAALNGCLRLTVREVVNKQLEVGLS
jgi:5-methyltetrahydropteroyltriglutamate--homocysteine methyltransferase